MADHPIKFPSPTDGPISQLCEEGAVKGGEVSVAFE
jgi:hypothetical protein